MAGLAAPVSKSERALLEKAGAVGLKVFGVMDAEALTGWKAAKARQALSRMVKKGLVKRLRRGKYALVGGESAPWLGQAAALAWPSYASFWSALSFHKFTDQLPAKAFVATTRQVRKPAGGTVVVVRVSPGRFFGYEDAGGFAVAGKEKALADSLYLPKHAGGLKHVFECLKRAWLQVDQHKLVECVLRMKSKALAKRLGFLIELAGLPVESGVVESLRKARGGGYAMLDSAGGRACRHDARWGIAVNVDEDEFRHAGEII